MVFTENNRDSLLYMTAPNISAVHAFTTRHGGVSRGIWRSLNLGEHRGDACEDVRKNYEILCRALGVAPDRLVFARQVHENGVRCVDADDAHTLFAPVPYEADGLVTAEKGLVLVIFYADCLPLLFHDPVQEVIAAAHAGWRGTVSDIAGETVRKMQTDFHCDPQNIRAAIGPGISKCCFETGPEVPAAVLSILGSGGAEFLSRSGEKAKVDLKGVNAALLHRAGVSHEHILISDECTMCKKEKYWSHRATHGQRGSQAAVIMLKGQGEN